MTRLPESFVIRMRNLFDQIGKTDEFPEFLNSFDEPPVKAVRINRNKVYPDEFRMVLGQILSEGKNLQQTKEEFRKVPWSDDGWVLPPDASPGKHPYYSAGLFYIQEPSAMLPAYLAKARPGDKVLDLCAAPGGKTVKLSADMQNTGLLISNDISSERIRPLLRNIDLTGCTNCLVTNESPEKLAGAYPEFFDIILADAPCSGEGMFRRDDNAIKSWSEYGKKCPAIQKDILNEADRMLKPGGRLVYSTCTFSPEENEEIVVDFIKKHPGYKIADVFDENHIEGERGLLQSGVSRGTKINGFDTHLTARIFPHLSLGEGHFCAVLEKSLVTMGDKACKTGKTDRSVSSSSAINSGFNEAFSHFAGFVLSDKGADRLFGYFKSHLKIYKDHVYTFNMPFELPDNIDFAKKGFFIGKIIAAKEKTLFEPSHQLLTSLRAEDLKRSVSFEPGSTEIMKYLRGETIFLKKEQMQSFSEPGHIAIETDGFPIGWGKLSMDGSVKNMYPKGWRKQ